MCRKFGSSKAKWGPSSPAISHARIPDEIRVRAWPNVYVVKMPKPENFGGGGWGSGIFLGAVSGEHVCSWLILLWCWYYLWGFSEHKIDLSCCQFHCRQKQQTQGLFMCLHFHRIAPRCLVLCGLVGRGGVTKRACREGRVPEDESSHECAESELSKRFCQARSCQRTPCSLCSSVTLTITEHPLCIQLWARRWEHIYKLTLSLHKPWETFTLKKQRRMKLTLPCWNIIRLPSKKSLLHQWSEVTIWPQHSHELFVDSEHPSSHSDPQFHL